jgi:hypothetical protein
MNFQEVVNILLKINLRHILSIHCKVAMLSLNVLNCRAILLYSQQNLEMNFLFKLFRKSINNLKNSILIIIKLYFS